IAAPAPGPALWLEQLGHTPPTRRRAVLESLLAEEIRRVLGAGGGHRIAPRQRLFDLGLDSLTAVELKNRLTAALACPLPATLLFDYPTLDALAGHLCAAVPDLASDPAAPAESQAPADSRAADLEQMSQDELEDLLATKLLALAG
ncbi:MAG: acyl carrier protein, partial [Candidatus Methylumidiphilus sp.]